MLYTDWEAASWATDRLEQWNEQVRQREGAYPSQDRQTKKWQQAYERYLDLKPVSAPASDDPAPPEPTGATA